MTNINVSISHFALEVCSLDMQIKDVCSVQTAFVHFIDLKANTLHWQHYFIQRRLVLLTVAMCKILS